MLESETNEPISDVLPTLRKQHPLRRQAEATLLDLQAPVWDLRPVLSALTGPFLLRRNEPLVASWLIAHANWSDDQRITLSEQLSLKVEKAMKGERTDCTLLRWLLRFLLVSALLCFTLFVRDTSIRGLYSIPVRIVECGYISLMLTIPLTLVGLVASVPLSLWIRDRRRPQLAAAIEALVELGHPSCIASLTMATVHGHKTLDTPLWDDATSALKRVLSELRPDDLGTLPARTVPALCNALTVLPHAETSLLLLKALTVIGDGRAIRKVESLSRNASDPEVREAAANLLPILQQRHVEQQSSSLLLRASNNPPEIGQTLLRPSREQSNADPTQLLRIAISREDNERP